MRSTGSHAKFILADGADGGWTACVSSCNWLSSPFQAVEFSVVLRDPGAVVQVVRAAQQLIGHRGLSDSLANELAIVARQQDLPKLAGGSARVGVIVGDAHDYVMRSASGAVRPD